MEILIINFLTPEYSDINYKILNWWNCSIPNSKLYTVSEICENWPFDYNISRLKNKCLDVAKKLKPDWMILMPGIDCAIKSLPNFKTLDKNKIYYGCKVDSRLENKQPASMHLYSSVVYENFRYDEKHAFYYDDFDFFFLKTKTIEKQKLDSFLCVHLNHQGLLYKNDFVKNSYEKSKIIFEEEYLKTFSVPFVYPK